MVSPLYLIEEAIGNIYDTASTSKPLNVQALEFADFGYWLAGATFLLLLGKTVSSTQKDMVNHLLDISTPEEILVRLPQAMSKTKTIVISNVFWDDHADRTQEGKAKVIKRTAKETTVVLDERAYSNLISDLQYYADKEGGPDDAPAGLVRSAKAALKRLTEGQARRR